ncbi:hypothetical protein [Prescottella equi]|uniref:hypothetical protein n=1 Tax=Rhodococcus hoagii TaxID=43767 RepID=UPI0007CD9CF0|nr:hypothetical protein [Prescottella equi]
MTEHQDDALRAGRTLGEALRPPQNELDDEVAEAEQKVVAAEQNVDVLRGELRVAELVAKDPTPWLCAPNPLGRREFWIGPIATYCELLSIYLDGALEGSGYAATISLTHPPTPVDDVVEEKVGN